MAMTSSLINELESAISNKDIAHRAETLRRLTDLFVLGSAKYSGEQIALFDDVMSRLIDEGFPDLIADRRALLPLRRSKSHGS